MVVWRLGAGSTTPFIWKEALEAFQLLLSVVSCCHFSCGEGLFKWASTRFIFGAGFFKESAIFSFPPPLSAGSRLLDSFAESAHPSLMRRCQLRSQGVHREGPLGPSSSQVLPGASPRRSWILHFLLWGLGGVLSFFKVSCSQVPVP
jgi:hypothetical protein